jgi:branched-chain amino acid transport system substrate-binding protein
MEIFNSSQLAVDGWNAKGGIQGVKIEHVMGDDAMSPAQGVNVAQKFTADPLIYGIIGPPMSHMAQATMKIYGRANLVCITTAASKPDLTHQGFKHFFRVNARNDAHGWNCALFMQRNLKAKKVAVLNEKVAYCEKSLRYNQWVEKLGITDVIQDTIVGGADYSIVLKGQRFQSTSSSCGYHHAGSGHRRGAGQRAQVKATFFEQKGLVTRRISLPRLKELQRGLCVPFAPDASPFQRPPDTSRSSKASTGPSAALGLLPMRP